MVERSFWFSLAWLIRIYFLEIGSLQNLFQFYNSLLAKPLLQLPSPFLLRGRPQEHSAFHPWARSILSPEAGSHA